MFFFLKIHLSVFKHYDKPSRLLARSPAVTVSLTFFVGERRDRPLLHLHVEAAREAGRHRCARRGRGVRVAAGKQQKLHVLRDAVAEGRASQGESARKRRRNARPGEHFAAGV